MRQAIDQAFRAGQIWPVLVNATANLDQPFLTYTRLSEIVGTIPLAVRYALDPIQRYCIEEGLPPLTILVVSKTSGKQGIGYVGRRDNGALQEVLSFPWETLENPFSNLKAEEVAAIASDLIMDPETAPDRYVLTLARGNQQRVFRQAVLEAYGYQCCVCRTSYVEVLEAAHIVPWRLAAPGLRIDPRNGLSMCANHHRLYDRRLFSVSTDLKIVCECADSGSESMSETDAGILAIYHGTPIALPKIEAVWPLVELLEEREAL